MWIDIERRAASFAIPYAKEPRHPVDPTLISLRVAMVAAREGWCPEFTKAYYRAWFLDDRPAGLDNNMPGLLASLGRDPEDVLGKANEESFGATLDASADEARRIGLFGSPHFVVRGEVFWGDDRLEDALKMAMVGSAA
jgi:2-hydroxychromene-2-carboxylate isomerase